MEQIKGYEGIYEIHLTGSVDEQPQIWSIKSSKYLRGKYDKDGYKVFGLCSNGKQKTFKLHRLVAQHFIDNHLNLQQVDHIDRNKQNNKLSNLRWVSQSGNQQNRVSKGYIKRNNGYETRIRVNGQLIVGGIFNTPEEANIKYIELKKLHHPHYNATE